MATLEEFMEVLELDEDWDGDLDDLALIAMKKIQELKARIEELEK